MKFPFRLFITLALSSAVAVECGMILPKMQNTPTLATCIPESMQPYGKNCFNTETLNDMAGIVQTLNVSMAHYQENSTKAVHDYIAEYQATEEARQQHAIDKAQAKKDFLEEQRFLAEEIERLKQEALDAKKNEGHIITDQLFPDYNMSGDNNFYIGPVPEEGNADYVINIGPKEEVTQEETIEEEKTPVVETYFGEFEATMVCTCDNCFNPIAWPQAILNSSSVYVHPGYIEPNIEVILSGNISGTFTTKDGTSLVNGRQMLLFHSDHIEGHGNQATIGYVKANRK